MSYDLKPSIGLGNIAITDKWQKIIPKQINTTSLKISGPVYIDDIQVNYDSELDTEGTDKENFGLAKILEQVIDEILDKTPIDE